MDVVGGFRITFEGLGRRFRFRFLKAGQVKGVVDRVGPGFFGCTHTHTYTHTHTNTNRV